MVKATEAGPTNGHAATPTDGTVKPLSLHVGPSEAGLRLDELLARRLRRLSRMRIASLVARGACVVNGRTAHAGHRINPGDTVAVALGEEGGPSSMTPEDLPLEIVYEDEELIVVVKPSGMLVHPTRGVKRGTLANALAFHLNRHAPAVSHDGPEPGAGEVEDAPPVVRPGLVHRLDRDTSGLMVVAKTQRALSILSRHFHERLVEKTYLALLEGLCGEDERFISAPIGRDPEARPPWRVIPEGRDAHTRLRVLARRHDTTLVELEPLTGRTNQLRIHCAHLGHPVVGDRIYGDGRGPRLCLHAARLAFHHPTGGRLMEFASPLPPEIEELFT